MMMTARRRFTHFAGIPGGPAERERPVHDHVAHLDSFRVGRGSDRPALRDSSVPLREQAPWLVAKHYGLWPVLTSEGPTRQARIAWPRWRRSRSSTGVAGARGTGT